MDNITKHITPLNKYDIQRGEIFKKYNLNLNLIINKYPTTFGRLSKSAYYCPLCLKGFEINATIGPKPHLTLEHVIPESVGGKKKVLTCMSCNNNMGARVDSQLSKHIDAIKFLNNEPTGKIDTIFCFRSGLNLKGKVSHKDSSGNKLLLSSNTNKFLEDKLETFFKNNGKLDMLFNLPTKKTIVQGVVKSAFLYAFYKLGYGFIFTKYGQILRDSILNNSESLEYILIDSNLKPGLYLIESPSDCDGYIVSLNINNLTFCTVLPGSSENYIFKNMKKPTQLKFRFIDHFDIFNNVDQFHWPFTHWYNK